MTFSINNTVSHHINKKRVPNVFRPTEVSLLNAKEFKEKIISTIHFSVGKHRFYLLTHHLLYTYIYIIEICGTLDKSDT